MNGGLLGPTGSRGEDPILGLALLCKIPQLRAGDRREWGVVAQCDEL